MRASRHKEYVPYELVAAEGAGAPSVLLALFVADGDGALVHGRDACVGDGNSVYVSCEVAEHGGLALAGMFAADVPLLGPYSLWLLGAQGRLAFFHQRAELGAQDRGCRAHGDEIEVFGFTRRRAVLGDAAARDQQMGMGMVAHLRGRSVRHGEDGGGHGNNCAVASLALNPPLACPARIGLQARST